MAVTVSMPQLGETVTEGTILSWAKKPGDSISEDEVLLEISTDKVDTEIPSPAAGIVREILVPEGDTVSVGTALAVIAAEGEGKAATPAPETAEQTPAADAPAAPSGLAMEPAAEPRPVAAAPEAPAAIDPAAGDERAASATDEGDRRGILSPVVRKLAREHGLNLDLITGSGTGGRITRKDVMTFIETVGATGPETKVTLEPSPSGTPAGDEVVKLTRLRRMIAENMISAKRTAAHVWTSVEVDYENVERVRSTHRAAFRKRKGSLLPTCPSFHGQRWMHCTPIPSSTARCRSKTTP